MSFDLVPTGTGRGGEGAIHQGRGPLRQEGVPGASGAIFAGAAT